MASRLHGTSGANFKEQTKIVCMAIVFFASLFFFCKYFQLSTWTDKDDCVIACILKWQLHLLGEVGGEQLMSPIKTNMLWII